MGSPLLSIITVCLNAEERIIKTLCSIEKQTFDNFEWIIIDGGSKDQTVAIANRYDSTEKKIISEPDDGIYDAMNKGISFAKGRYLLFLNAGDSLYSNETLSIVESYLDRDIIIGNLIVVDKNGDISSRRYETYGIGRDYLYERTLPHQSTFINRNLFIKHGMYDKKFLIKGDHDFFARIYQHRVIFHFIPIFISIYYLDGISWDMKNSFLVKKELSLVRKRNFSFFYRLRKAILNSIK